jgi:hypothetical protein
MTVLATTWRDRERAFNYRIKLWNWNRYVQPSVMRRACRVFQEDSRRQNFKFHIRPLRRREMMIFESKHSEFDATTSPTACETCN